MVEPTDEKLYNTVKKKIYKEQPKHSAYRSGTVVKEYKKRFTKKYGKRKSPYKGNKTKKSGLKRWFDEKWVDINPILGFKDADAYPLFRPTKYVNSETPTLFQEIPKSRLKEQYKLKQKIKGERNLPTFLPEVFKPKKVGGMIVRALDY